MVELSTIEAGTAGFVINGVSADDRAGFDVSDIGDMNGDGLADVIVTAPEDDPNATGSGAAFVVFGRTGTTAVELSDIEAGTGGFVINGASTDDQVGQGAVSAGDVNGDGVVDVIIGAVFDDPNGADSGAAFVVFGKSTTTAVELSDVSAGTGGFVINGAAVGDFAGVTVDGGGDINGDGLTDLIVGSSRGDPNGSNSGTTAVVFGKATTTKVEISDITAGTGGFIVNGVSAADQAGIAVASTGDVNGDGLADLIIGGYLEDNNGTNSGSAFVVFGKATTTTVELSDVEAGTGGFIINGVAADDRTGRAVAGAGDINGDGTPDLIIGARTADRNGVDSGAAFVVFGKSSTTAVELSDVVAGTGGFVINGVSAGDEAGFSVGGIGDFNGDGTADVIVGARNDDPNGADSGAAFVVYGKSTTAAVELSDVEAGTGGFVLNGNSAGDLAGASVSSAGDVNGDGAADVIVGAQADDPNGSNSGASFVIFGTPAPVTAVTTTDSTDLPAINTVINTDGTTSFTLANNTGITARGLLIGNTGNNNLVAATLPNRVTLASSGTSTAEETTRASTSIASQISATADAANGEALLLAGAADFMAGKAGGTLFDIRTLTPTVSGAQTLTEAIILTGSTDGAGEEAFVIDTRGLPTGSVIQLDNIEFAAIVGAATLTGGAGRNHVVGDGSAQNISLGDLDDTLVGGAGDDTIGSRFGEDILYGNQGNDAVRGGGGLDTLYGGQGEDTLDGANVGDVLFGNAGADFVRGGQGADAVYGNQAVDTVSGGAGLDSLFGGQGDDILYGNTGADILAGNAGADLLYGGQDADTLSGGAGVDTLVGGTGADSFVLSAGDGADEAFDFSVLQDDRLLVDIAGTAITTLADLAQAVGTDVAGNLLIDLGSGDNLSLLGLTTSDISSIGVDLLSGGVSIATGTLDGAIDVATNATGPPAAPVLVTLTGDQSPLLAAPPVLDLWP